jgi:hypothetical protein
MRTCPFQPTVHSDAYQFPTLAQAAQKVRVRQSGDGNDIVTINIYNMMGQIYSTTSITQDGGMVTIPSTYGNYIVEIVYQNNEQRSQHLIVTQ